MARAKRCASQDGSLVGWRIECPGCCRAHVIPSTWYFNENYELPSFTPSLACHWFEDENQVEWRCHSVITDGIIAFCNDCTHALKNQKVLLPEISEHYG
jgi:hypothetical protein